MLLLALGLLLPPHELLLRGTERVVERCGGRIGHQPRCVRAHRLGVTSGAEVRRAEPCVPFRPRGLQTDAFVGVGDGLVMAPEREGTEGTVRVVQVRLIRRRAELNRRCEELMREGMVAGADRGITSRLERRRARIVGVSRGWRNRRLSLLLARLAALLLPHRERVRGRARAREAEAAEHVAEARGNAAREIAEADRVA